eukprot:gb/GEZN01007703.1/.p1 GENE.gb/GEZN01007703.1/~~gb/GEZN01007703.1/.p1  ORF type:complete len:349 (+),score=43.39 gb/GEZN01007703.1/:27-1049(+)
MGCLHSSQGPDPEQELKVAKLHFGVKSEILFSSSAELSAQLWNPDSKTNFFKHAQQKTLQEIDIFVSHVWVDKTYIKARSDLFFWDIKTTGVMKCSKQLVQREIPGLKGRELSDWIFWLDRACVDQSNKHMRAHATEVFDDYIQSCRGLVVLLSPDYLSRLWCVFEYSCFLAFHQMNEVSIYTWAFMDSPDTGDHMVERLRTLSISSCQCSFESDRVHLVNKVAELYVNEKAFERFAKFTGIAMIVHSLFASPAVFSQDRADKFLKPWYALARELGFEDLAKVLEGWPVVDQYVAVQSQAPPDQNPIWGQTVQLFVSENLMSLVAIERKLALRSEPKTAA